MFGNAIARREFVKIIFAAMTTGTLLTNATVAIACEQVEPDKITETIAKAKRIISTGEEGDLISYMLAHFDAASTNAEEVRLFLDFPEHLGIKGDILSYEELQRLTDGLVPIAVMRELIGKHRMRFDGPHYKEFTNFVVRYRELFLPFFMQKVNHV